MENAAKALAIAGGVLIALVIAASLMYTFNRMSEIPDKQDYLEQIEQLTQFNAQFEAYQKKLMYGVDVISCLNKVIDNNEKADKYTDGKYKIKISVNIINTIQDKFEVYHIDERTRKEVRDFKAINKKVGELFDTSDISESITKSDTKNTELTTGEFDSNLKNGNYTYEDKDNDNLLYKLSKSTVELRKEAVNPDKNSATDWTRVIWYTAAYDFKSRRFRCTGIGYDDEGRVNSISFIEHVS